MFHNERILALKRIFQDEEKHKNKYTNLYCRLNTKRFFSTAHVYYYQ